MSDLEEITIPLTKDKVINLQIAVDLYIGEFSGIDKRADIEAMRELLTELNELEQRFI
jgi:hypothetical protein